MATDTRLTQGVLEVLVAGGPPDTRLTQGVLEVLVAGGPPDTQLTQGVLEVVLPTDQAVYLTQQVVEVVRTGTPDAQLTQLVLEVIRVDSGTGAPPTVSVSPATLLISLLPAALSVAPQVLSLLALTISVVPDAIGLARPLTGTLVLVVSGQSVIQGLGLAPLTVSASWQSLGGQAPYSYDWETPASLLGSAATLTQVFGQASGLLALTPLAGLVSDAVSAEVSAVVPVSLRHVHWPNYFDGCVQPESQVRRRTWPT